MKIGDRVQFDNQLIGQTIRRLRLEKGISQEMLSGFAGIARTHLTMIENGKKTIPVRSFTVAGNFYELLKNIAAVADNVTLPWATGKTAFGAPSVLVEGLSIAGK